LPLHHNRFFTNAIIISLTWLDCCFSSDDHSFQQRCVCTDRKKHFKYYYSENFFLLFCLLLLMLFGDKDEKLLAQELAGSMKLIRKPGAELMPLGLQV
jgi:hypothetical protein